MTTKNEVKEIIKKWYNALGFKRQYDDEFYAALESIYVDGDRKAESYNQEDPDGKKNFLYYLYFSEEMERAYEDMGIDREIFLDSVKDLVTWTDIWSELKGELHLGEIDWLWHIFTLRIMKLGRLQYNRAAAREAVPEKGINKGDPVLDIHIPARGPLDSDECRASLDMAKKFYKKFYPEFDYKCFTCHSWLLDTTLKDLLKPDSNILKFQTLFNITALDQSRAILAYTIRWKIKDEELKTAGCKSDFAKQVRSAYLAGRRFYAGYGIIDK